MTKGIAHEGAPYVTANAILPCSIRKYRVVEEERTEPVRIDENQQLRWARHPDTHQPQRGAGGRGPRGRVLCLGWRRIHHRTIPPRQWRIVHALSMSAPRISATSLDRSERQVTIYRDDRYFTKNPDIVLLPGGKLLCVFNETDYHWPTDFSRINGNRERWTTARPGAIPASSTRHTGAAARSGG